MSYGCKIYLYARNTIKLIVSNMDSQITWLREIIIIEGFFWLPLSILTFVYYGFSFLTGRHEGFHDVSRPARSVQISPLHPEGLCQCTCKPNPLLRSKCSLASVDLWTSSCIYVINTLHLIIKFKYVHPCRANFCTAILLQAFMRETSSHSTRSS